MKRISLLTAALIFACVSFAQMTRLSETLVESPKYNGDNNFTLNEESTNSPICQYLQNKITNNSFYKEGVVAVLFTVKADGTLSDLTVENSVSKSVDQSVVQCIQSSSGHWTPGMVNGTPTEMQRRIMVGFYDPAKGTLNEQGNANLQVAIRKYHAAVAYTKSLTLSHDKASRKADNRLNSAIKLLANAERFLPSEPSVVFWQAATYEQKGDEMLKNQKLSEFESLVDPMYQAQVESVEIAL